MVAEVISVSYAGSLDQSDSVEISPRHFGTVVTSGFGWAGYASPSTSYAVVNYPDAAAGEFQVGSRLDIAVDAIGATSLRYPGGTEAWSSFKWRENDQATDATGLTEIEKLHKVIDYCARKGLGLDFTFPTRGFDQAPSQEREAIEGFFNNQLLSYAEAKGVPIFSIKIGNEYNVGQSAGFQMSAEHYSDLASQLTLIIGESLDFFGQGLSATSDWQRPDVIIESGVIWRYGAADIGTDIDNDGRPDGNGVQDTLDIFLGFSTEEASYVSGIDLHNLTLHIGFDEFFGREALDGSPTWESQSALLSTMTERWSQYTQSEVGFTDIEFHSLAWSHPRNSSVISETVESATMSILQLHALASAGVESASSWYATGFAGNALVAPAVFGQSPAAGNVTAAGKALGQMSDSLIGLKPIQIDVAEEALGILVIGFADQHNAVLYVSNTSDDNRVVDLDIHDLLASISNVSHYEIEHVSISDNGTSSSPQQLHLQAGLSRGAQSIELDLLGNDTIEITLTVGDEAFLGRSDRVLIVEAKSDEVLQLSKVSSSYELYVGANLYKFSEIDTIRFLDKDYSLQELSNKIEPMSEPLRGRTNIIGTAFDDHLVGSDYADLLDGNAGVDHMEGGLGDDTYFVDNIGDKIVGELGYSIGGGIDTIWSSVDFEMPVNTEILRLSSPDRGVNLSGIGNDGPGTLVGDFGANLLLGRGGNDQINGNYGNDVLVGGVGRDILVGGAGADTFAYFSFSESRYGAAHRDVINGFEQGHDKIDLKAIDADTTSFRINDSFEFIGFAMFGTGDGSSSGQLRLQNLGGPNGVIVEGDHNGDGAADFQILILGTFSLSETDFFL